MPRNQRQPSQAGNDTRPRNPRFKSANGEREFKKRIYNAYVDLVEEEDHDLLAHFAGNDDDDNEPEMFANLAGEDDASEGDAEPESTVEDEESVARAYAIAGLQSLNW